MKKIFFILLLLIITTGCTVKEEKIQKQLDEIANKAFANKFPPIKYNFEDFTYEGNE